MTTGETDLQMSARHVAEQEKRIAGQEALIVRLDNVGASTVQATELLEAMHEILGVMRAHLAQLSN